MAKPRINKGSQIIDSATELLNDKVKSLEPKFLNLLLDEIKKLDVRGGGIVSSTKRNKAFIRSFRERVRKLLTKTKYFDFVDGFLLSYDDLNNFTKDINKRVNQITIPTAQLSKWRTWGVDKVSFDLVKQGLDSSLIKPLRNEVTKVVNLGGNMKDLAQALENTLQPIGRAGGLLTTNSYQVSRDALGQYYGSINQQIADTFELDGIRYVGSLINDSRDQCRRWVDKKVLAVKDLQSEINWAFANGTGMIKDTTPSNFLQNRGGYNCRHTAIPVRL